MDTTDPDITFDSGRVCNYCHHTNQLMKTLPQSEAEVRSRLSAIAEKIRAHGKNHDYDCLLGISGGVDSSYVAYLAKQMGLHPLVVHFDNGWNSELAVKNINCIVDVLGFDLSTYVIDWEEFRELQRSFLKASVVDIEMLTDHAIYAAMFKIAKQHRIKYVLSGTNIATESGMPPSWIWNKQDLKNIKAIQRHFGTMKLKDFPTLGTWRWLFIYYLNLGFKFIDLLNNIIYKKHEAMATLERELGWRYYGGKHYESLFTKFYQAYILPEKFGIDKRKVHLSSLIRNSEITRDEALQELSLPLYDPFELRNDKEYVLKKLGFTEDEFEGIMQTPPQPHSYYPSNSRAVNFLKQLKNIITPKNWTGH